jgi:hypothetical protein
MSTLFDKDDDFFESGEDYNQPLEQLGFIGIYNKILSEEILRKAGLRKSYFLKNLNVDIDDVVDPKILTGEENAFLTGIILCKERADELSTELNKFNRGLSKETVHIRKNISILMNIADVFEYALIESLQKLTAETAGFFYVAENGVVVFFAFEDLREKEFGLFTVIYQEEQGDVIEYPRYPPDIVN